MATDAFARGNAPHVLGADGNAIVDWPTEARGSDEQALWPYDDVVDNVDRGWHEQRTSLNAHSVGR